LFNQTIAWPDQLFSPHYLAHVYMVGDEAREASVLWLGSTQPSVKVFKKHRVSH
jgi:hypothetical protein